MATQVTARALPTDRPPDGFTSPTFPKTKCSLWDKTSTGQPVFLHISYYRKPTVCIPEKILRLVQHQCENYGHLSHMLIGSLVVEDDGEGIQFQVDRLDTRPNIPPDGSGLAPGDLLIPLEVANNAAKERCGSVEDYTCALQRLQDRCCSKDSIDLCSFLLLRGWGSFYSNAHTSVAHLDFDMVTMATVFKATPIPPVPIVLTALSKNLAGPMSLSHMQGSPKSGYLTMDHTRKLLLVLESDPKTATLPVVGIWVSGVEFIQHPFVWAACLRYTHNTHLQDRVCKPPEEFLLVLYTKLHSRPEFYQCDTTSGNGNLQFELYTGHEVTNMAKALSSQKSDNFSEIEMAPVDGGTKMEVFDAAKANHGLFRASNDMENGWINRPEDIEPRSAPTPHTEKVPVFRPVVPDVSILWTEPSETFNNFPRSSIAPSQRGNMLPQKSLSTPPVNNAKTVIPHSVANPATPATSFRQPFPGNGGFSYQGQPAHRQGYQQIHSIPQASQMRPSFSQQYSPQSQLPQQPLPPQFISSQPQSQYLPMSGIQTLQTRQCYNTVQNSLSSQGSGNNIHLPASTSIPQGAVHPTSIGKNPSIGLQENSHHIGLNSYIPQVDVPQPTQPTSQLPAYQTAGIGIPPGNTETTPQPARNTYPQQCQQQMCKCSSQNAVSITTNRSSPADNESSIQQIPQNNSTESARFIPTQHPQHQQQMQQVRRMPPPTPSNVMFTPSPNPPQSQNVITNGLNSIHASQGTVVAAGVRNMSLNNNLRTHPHTYYPSSANNGHNPMTFLKTVLEEPSPSSSTSSSSSERVSQPVERKSLNSNLSRSDVTIGSNHTVNVSESSHINSNSSGRSSDDDSGLSVTPDRLNPNPEDQIVPPSSSHPVGPKPPIDTGVLPASIENVNWNQVPPEIRTLLIHQNEQLKVLQQQIQLLLQNQSQTSAQSSSSSVGSDNHSKNCSVAVNTTGIETDSSERRSGSQNQYDSRSAQTSPVKPVLQPLVASPVSLQDSLRRGMQAEMDLNPGELVDAMASMPVCEHTMNTVASDMIVDMPDYVSSVSERSQCEHSPTSVSDFYGNCPDQSYSTVAEDAADPRQYYSQLMNNIQMFLTNSNNQDSEQSIPDDDQSELNPEPSTPKHTGSANSTVAPQINYMSMMLGYGSDSSQSMEINAMAMKYLNDEQLTCMAKLRQHSSGQSQNPNYSAKILQRVISGNKSLTCGPSTPDVSHFGISPNDMTMGTQKYLEKHGLLGNDGSVFDHGYSDDQQVFDMFKLKTDFSMVTNGSDALKANISQATSGMPGTPSSQPSPSQSPIRKEIIGRKVSPLPRNNENWLPNNVRTAGLPKDLGASPVLRLPQEYNQEDMVNGYEGGNAQSPEGRRRVANNKRNVLKEVRPQAYRNTDQRSRDTASPVTSEGQEAEEEEENILDIERLKQMPKLL